MFLRGDVVFKGKGGLLSIGSGDFKGKGGKLSRGVGDFKALVGILGEDKSTT